MITVTCDACWATLSDRKPDVEYKGYRLYDNQNTSKFLTSFHFCAKCLAEKETFHISFKSPDYTKPTE